MITNWSKGKQKGFEIKIGWFLFRFIFLNWKINIKFEFNTWR